MTILPGSSGVRLDASGQGRMRRGDDHDWRCVIKERVFPQRQADVDTGQLVQLLVEHQDVVAAASGELERLLARAGSRDVVSLLRENALEGATQPLVTAADQSDQFARIRLGHEVASVRVDPAWCGGLAP